MMVIFSSVLADVAFATVVCLRLLYVYFVRAFKYWERLDVHYVRPKLFFGNVGQRGVAEGEPRAVPVEGVRGPRSDTPVVGIFAMHKPILVACEAGVIRQRAGEGRSRVPRQELLAAEDVEPLISKSLLVLKGKRWRHVRIKLAPAFTSGKIKKMFHLINKCGEELLPCIDQEISKGEHG
ncbi:hypothetical protein PR048_027499 [Dryococelus australis]|uniref:Uncharacterized protein n=1 Tax=Dryococelus australis TaxID=614101 RepID=A0ABQ9GGP6_9NEOP|nr:hypothetical protein PR048_027499 [Dryococelus australis]